MSKSFQQSPYKGLGLQLKSLREKRKESLVEVSGAVEIDTDALLSIEQGDKLPTEDILLLLISHFDLHKDDALNLWKLAGYDQAENHGSEHMDTVNQSAIVVLPIDARILYTDLVNISTNNYGLTMNFLQTSGSKNGQPLSVARVGMSREHAESVLNVLKKVLDTQTTKTKLLDQSTNKKQKENKKDLRD
jgi:hypothetical protein